MNNKPLVSIILTSYNHSKYLNRALDSIFNQTYSNIEVIVVDDCSTDESHSILYEYKEKYPKLQLNILEINSGSYVNSTNFGFSLASGEFVNFAQCDDYSDNRQIEKLVEKAIQNPEAGVVYSKSHLIDSSGFILTDDFKTRELAFRKKCKNDNLISGNLMLQFLSYSCVIPNLSSALIKRDLYAKSGGLSTKYKVAADWALWMNLTSLTDFYYITEPLNYFRQHPNTIRNTIKLEHQIFELFDIFYNFKKNNNLSLRKSLNLYIGSNIVWIGFLLFDKKYFTLYFFKIMSKSLKYNKFNFIYFTVCLLKVIKESIFRNRLFSLT